MEPIGFRKFFYFSCAGVIIKNAIREDVGSGDYSSLACIPVSATGKAKLLVKEDGIIAGVAFAKMIFEYVDANLQIETFIEDGTSSLEKCSVCGGELIYTGGCKQCAGCGDSKCN